jgi:hypothetical protein
MEKRVLFKSTWLPWLLIAPQMAVILVFFFWPAGQAVYQSVLQQDAFGTSAAEFVGFENFDRLFSDPSYLASFYLEPPAQQQPRHGADRDGRGVEADFLQLPVLPGGAAVHPQVADRSRRH